MKEQTACKDQTKSANKPKFIVAVATFTYAPPEALRKFDICLISSEPHYFYCTSFQADSQLGITLECTTKHVNNLTT